MEDRENGPAQILIIDDEESILDGCRQALEKSGYTVVTSSDGHEGIGLRGPGSPTSPSST
jgi:DNA-binding response OmpR family regulator